MCIVGRTERQRERELSVRVCAHSCSPTNDFLFSFRIDLEGSMVRGASVSLSSSTYPSTRFADLHGVCVFLCV